MKAWEYLVVLGGCVAAFLFALFRKKCGDTPCELSPGAVGVVWLCPHPFMVWEGEGGTDSVIHPHMGPARVLM